MKIISSIEELNEIYGAGLSQASVDKVTKRLTPLYRGMIEISPFVALATVGPEGLDCSPRGDLGGVVRIVDDTVLHLPDWRGNNRVDSLSNIVRDPRLSLMFLIPGSNTVMRINGRGVVSNDEALLSSFEMDGKHPRTVIVVSIVEVYFQCARAVMRAELWNAEHFVDPANLPTPGQMLKDAVGDFDHETYDREWPVRAAKTMW
ncbi:pyridoxamine 5'-phosphate oxidase family protein [Rhizobium sp. 1399]|jgi:PPOX class probable FMN-dependent enzyme|uniref:pyridoxamine 5'-phosphate oxidase family protein n=1 Tax=Rhizobium sp. 1399 TaxID=2817758 RepID=UPI002856374D|nr:pyridoxamine 5'-phosphate oxidase family protein [Rhizobium sp. 1399]MDR6669625.1 PPOX class probable FMN-dependent enzyme [Rhizobium sp. 1399]